MIDLSEQEMFDIAYVGVVSQGGPSTGVENGMPTCLYLNPEGRRCAAGHVFAVAFPDDVHKIDDSNGSAIWACGVLGLGHRDALMDSATVQFLLNLQHYHDNNGLKVLATQFNVQDSVSDSDFIESYKSGMASLAQEHGLVVPNVS